jgi:hypothetical protein
LLDGGDTVTVLVLVLTDVLIDVLTLGSVDVVVWVGAVVSADGGEVVSVTVCVGATAGADPDGADVVVVVEVVVSVLSDESDIRLTNNHTMRAMRIATSAPNPTSAAGLRYQGTGGSGGWPGWPGCS